MQEEVFNILRSIKSISLNQMESAQLMSRVDTKFYFHERMLPEILHRIQNDYFILEINGERLMPYESDYYDTSDLKMLRWHQNGKLNRFKIRNRKYLVSNQSYLEIKKKNNKGITEKIRILNSSQKDENQIFITDNTPFEWLDLKPVIGNSFDRIMLVNKNMKERASIDLNLKFISHNEIKKIENLVLLEIKSDRHIGITPIQRILKNMHIYPNGFSKYITGMYMFHGNLKFNRFKKRFLNVNKTIEKTLL